MATNIPTNGSGTVTTPVVIRGAVYGVFKDDMRNYVAHGWNTIGNDIGPALQAAHDANAARINAAPVGQNWIAKILVPSFTPGYQTVTTCWKDNKNVQFYGEGSGSLIQTGNLNRTVPSGAIGSACPPVFAMGYRRPSTIGGSYAANFGTYRPDLFGKLDTTIATASGQRWGFRTNTNAFVMAHASQFAMGGLSPTVNRADAWYETQTLTIEFAVEGFNGSGQIPNNTNLFGSGMTGEGTLAPFFCHIDGSGNFKLDWQTWPNWTGTVSGFGVQFAQSTGVQRVTIQINLITANVTAWLNGIQQYTGTGINNMSPGNVFRENDDYAFWIAGTGIQDGWSQTFSDFAVYGLALSRTIRYNISTNGSTQVRTAGSTPYASVHDNYRYNDDGTDHGNGTTTGLVAYFYFSEPANVNDPMLFIGGAGGQAIGAFIGLGASGQLSLGGISNQGVSNMRLVSRAGYSSPLYVVHVLDPVLDDLDINGGWHAIANLPIQSNYTLILNRPKLAAGSGDSAYYLNVATAQVNSAEIFAGGRVCRRIRDTNLTDLSTFQTGVNAGCEVSILRSHGGNDGGNVVMKRANIDLEGGPFPTRAVFYLSAGPAESFNRFEDNTAGESPNIPLFLLDSNGGNKAYPDNVIEVDNSFAWFNTATPCVLSNGLTWKGTFKNMALGQSPHLQTQGTYGNGAPFVFEDRTYPAPPHQGNWYPGAHNLDVPLYADGLWGGYRCVAPGLYGSTTPPKWIGINAYQSSAQALAGLAFDHTCIATTFGGGSNYGWLADQATASVLQTLFGQSGGALATTPATIHFDLVTVAPLKPGIPGNFCTGNGYTGATQTNNATNFPAASAGTKANATAFSFGTLTGPVTAVGIAIHDGNLNLIGYVNFTTPQTFAGSTTPTVGVGALTFTQTPTNTPGFMTQYGWGKIFDYWFSQASLGTPGTWYVGLNTAHASVSSAPTEPSTGAYARAALTNDATHWTTGQGRGSYVLATNGAAPSFPTPTGSGWGSILGTAIFDAATSGHAWFVADAPEPVSCPAGSPPTIGIGALLLTI